MNKKQEIESKERDKEISKNSQETEKKDKLKNIQEIEDVTTDGEFISSYFEWISPDKQKKKANEIENITKS